MGAGPINPSDPLRDGVGSFMAAAHFSAKAFLLYMDPTV